MHRRTDNSIAEAGEGGKSPPMNPHPPAAGLPVDTYLAAIERETRRFRECLADADPGLRVPT